MPMIDYEAEVPAAVTAAYVAAAGPFPPLGSPLMPGAAHMARQLLWLETAWPEMVARARWYLGGPQYWAFRLSGGARERTHLSRRADPFLELRHRRLLAHRARARLAAPDRAGDAGLAAGRAGSGRSSPPATAFPRTSRSSAASTIRAPTSTATSRPGLRDLTLISTGTWIVGLSDERGAGGGGTPGAS